MTTSDVPKVNWPRVVKREFLPRLPNFVSQGRLLYRRPVEKLLRGFYIDVSGFKNSAAFIHCFIMPLYVPHAYVTLDFGRRLRAPDSLSARWDANCIDEVFAMMADVMSSEGVSFLNDVQTPGDLAQKLGVEFGSLEDPHTLEALAYSHVIEGEMEVAIQTLAKLQRSLDPFVSWEREMSERVTRILGLTSTGSLDGVHDQFDTWRRFSMESLRIS